ncbi:MAG TPA: ATP-binding protein [Terriglobales bacterium]|nr:ATP-binding protein [Terriglobales bacterium]
MKFNWLDLVWLGVLASLAVLPPVREGHKQLILLAIGALQLGERWILTRAPQYGRSYVVLLKILLATLLIDHTGPEPSINSSYYPIYYLPVITAAIYFGPWGTLLWTFLAAAAYCSYLIPYLMPGEEFELTPAGVAELAIRILFFFLAGMVVNRFVVENRRQVELYQKLAEELAETNRRLEQAQAEARRSERLAALGQLSAGLAHEIRNPLGVIKGSAEMLSKKLQTSEPLAAELAGYISSEVNRLSALVSRFLDFARPLHAETAPQEVTVLLERALKSVGDQWRGGKIEVKREYAKEQLPVPLDENLCEQAFINLVQNAYEAMGDAGGILNVQVSPAQLNGRRGVEVQIQDTGPGIPAELCEQIFNPFVTTKKTGVGLGLSIVSKIMDEHHGSIRVASNTNHGACFVLFFPVAENAVSLS